MVGHQWLPGINNSTRGAATETSVKQEQEMSSGFLCTRNEAPRRRACPAVGLSALCLSLLVACAALSVLYADELHGRPDWESLLDYQNMSDSVRTLTDANGVLADDNRILEKQVARLRQQNQLLGRSSAELESTNLALASESRELTERTLNLTSANARLAREHQRLVREQEAQRPDATRTLDRLVGANTRLQEEKRRLSETGGLLRSELLRAREENRELVEANGKFRGDVDNLTEQIRAFWKDDYGQLQETATQLRARNRNLSATLESERRRAAERERSGTRDMERTTAAAAELRAANEAFRALDLYCPVVERRSRERICKKCHHSWKQFEAKCYYFSSRTLTWSSSRSWCRTQGGDLLVVNSEQEQKFIFDSSSSLESSGSRLWIGLTDGEEEGDWHWVDGGRVTSDVQYWLNRPGVGAEPDDWKLNDPQGEDCGHIDTTEKELRSWMDGSCKIAYRWICEKDA